MPAVIFSRGARVTARGSALVIVLFFVILLSIVTIAFLSRSMTAIKVSASSYGETKSKILAGSASDIIIGDLKQEIIAGSAANSGTANWPVYAPSSNLTMIPFQNGVPTSGTLIPNMISRSVSPANTSGSDPYIPYTSTYTSAAVPPNRAASDPTATGTYTSSKVNSSVPSLNGRYVSAAQWNSHFLVPRDPSVDTPGSTSADSTPVPSFVPPDWVIVTRNGANSVTWSSGTGDLNDPTLTNTNYAIGRYAYAVYNEGGLLDMNAAGYPADPNSVSVTSPPFNAEGPNGLTSSQISKKGALALADLTQLAVGSVNLTQAQVNNLVGWRNYASAELTSASGSYGSFSFSSTSASNWLTNFVLGNTNGFLQIVPPASGVVTPPTDQALLSRKQLIGVVESLGISPDFLQYMGSFSRALEQPSTLPDPNRPLILSNGSPPPKAGGSPNEDTYIGNNDGEGGDNTINPSFLSIRVGSAFTRWNGATAVVGEPLVKTKFALSWLRMVAYNATNTSLPPGFAATASDSNPILDRFGLTRSSASSPWVYNHSITNSSGQNIIGTLSAVAAAGREPDFAELLKACIVAGSLAKGGPNLNIGGNNYQYTLDSSLDLQVLQIMANLIDQQDTDSFPTAIQFQNGTNNPTVYGVEDLPYFYRYHVLSVVDKAPTTPISNATAQVFQGIGTGTTTTVSITSALDYTSATSTQVSKSWTLSSGNAPYPVTINAMQAGSASGTGLGEATLMYIPDLWNPHDLNTLASETTSLRPANFRIYAVTGDPIGATTPWNIGAECQLTGSGNVTPVPANLTATPPTPAVPGQTSFKVFLPENDGLPQFYYWPIGNIKPFTAPASFTATGNNIMCFSDNGGALFREPTLLWNTNPTGILPSSGLTFGTAVSDANNSGVSYYGIVVGKAPAQMQVNIASTPPVPTDGTYLVQGGAIANLDYVPATAYPQTAYFLQYQDPNNASNWITYDVKYPDLHGLSAPNLVVNTAVDYATTYKNVLQTGQFSAHATTFDPRSARWGVGTASNLGEWSPGTHGNGVGISPNPPYALEPTAYANFNTPTLGQFSVLETDRARADKCDQADYSNPCMTSNPGQNVQMHWFSGAGYSASNGQGLSPLQFNGLFSQNNPAITFNSKGNLGATPPVAETPGSQLYVEDADGVARLAMGAFADTTLTDTSSSSLVQTTGSPQISSDAIRIGLPMSTADTLNNNGVSTATSQTQSRPIILNRPFRSVSEMSYAFRGTPWKNIDFFTPESGDSAMLDTFCLTEPPPSAMIAGRVDLNTRQTPVLQAIVAGAYRDEVNNSSASPPSYALPPLSGTEAANVAAKLEGITSDTTHAWRGPLKNISGLVGRFVASPGSTSGFTDFYTYTPPSANAAEGQLSSMTYAGLSAALDSKVYNSTANPNLSTPLEASSAAIIQRFREAGLRPLVDAGQVRVWNLLIDIVAQTGHYPKTAAGLDQFMVDGQTHLWVHVAIDRYTGQVIDKQVEVATP